MRVAVDVTPLVGPQSGIGHFVAELVDALAAHEDAPELIPYVLSLRARHDATRSGAARRVPWCFPETIEPPRYIPFPASVTHRAWGWGDRPGVDRWIQPADVVHGTNFVVPPSVRSARVMTIHDCSFVRHPEWCTAPVIAMERAVRRAIRSGAWVHTPSAFTAAEVTELLGADPRRVVVVPHGVPRMSQASGLGVAAGIRDLIDSGPYVLAIGTIEPRKNFHRLVVAFGLLAARMPNVSLVIAGANGPARAEVDAAIDSLPPDVRARVVLTGYVNDATRTALLQGAGVVAYPSLYEGFGLPILEAMVAGVPVVAAQTGATAEVAGDAVLLVDPLDPGALADGLTRVLDDQSLAGSLVASGRVRANGYSWERTASGMLDLYRRAVAARST